MQCFRARLKWSKRVHEMLYLEIIDEQLLNITIRLLYYLSVLLVTCITGSWVSASELTQCHVPMLYREYENLLNSAINGRASLLIQGYETPLGFDGYDMIWKLGISKLWKSAIWWASLLIQGYETSGPSDSRAMKHLLIRGYETPHWFEAMKHQALLIQGYETPPDSGLWNTSWFLRLWNIRSLLLYFKSKYSSMIARHMNIQAVLGIPECDISAMFLPLYFIPQPTSILQLYGTPRPYLRIYVTFLQCSYHWRNPYRLHGPDMATHPLRRYHMPCI